MSISTTDVFEKGVLRPIQPIALDEGAKVEVTIVSQLSNKENQSPAVILAEIAAMPSKGNHSESFSGIEHDSLLYGTHTG